MASVLARIDEEELGQGGPATRFLSGIHRPMAAELTLTQLEVRGTIPPALSGRYLRIGPNPVDADPASYHWFTGDGMVHGLSLGDGKAHWYRNRWIASQVYAAARGTTPAPGPRHGPGDTVNTNVVDLAGRTFALVEGAATRSSCPTRSTRNAMTISAAHLSGRSRRIHTAIRGPAGITASATKGAAPTRSAMSSSIPRAR